MCDGRLSRVPPKSDQRIRFESQGSRDRLTGELKKSSIDLFILIFARHPPHADATCAQVAPKILYCVNEVSESPRVAGAVSGLARFALITRDPIAVEPRIIVIV